MGQQASKKISSMSWAADQTCTKKVISVEQVDYFVDVPIASPLQLLIFFVQLFLLRYLP
jgi:hypothetical protein